jgi:hypothetical protein
MTQEPDAAFSKMLRTFGGTVVHMSAGYCTGSYIPEKKIQKVNPARITMFTRNRFVMVLMVWF